MSIVSSNEEIALVLSANIDRLKTGLGGGDREIDSFTKRATDKLKRVGAAVGAAVAGGVAAVSAGVGAAIAEMDRIGDISQRIGVGAEALTALGYAAEQSGAKLGDIETGLTKLSRTMAQAFAGNEKQAQLFDAIGVSITDATGELRSADQVFADIADRFQEYEDGAGEVALAQALMGKSATALVPLLNEGSEGIAELSDRAAALGVVMSEDAVAGAQQLGDSVNDLKKLANGFFNDLATALLPTLNDVATSLVDTGIEARNTGSAMDTLTGAIKVVIASAITAANVIGVVWEALHAGYDVLGTVGSAFESFGKQLGAGLAAHVAMLKGDLPHAMEILKEASADAAAETAERSKVIGDVADRMKDRVAAAASASADAWLMVSSSLDKVEAETKGVAAGVNAAGNTIKKIPPVVNAFAGATRTAADETEKLGDKVDDIVDPMADLAKLMDSTARTMGGPLEQAALDYKNRLVEIYAIEQRLLELGPPTIADQQAIMAARQQAADAYRQDLATIAAEQEEFNRRSLDGAQGSVDQIANAYDDLGASLGAAFSDLLSGQIDDWRDFGRALMSIADQFLGSLQRQFQQADFNVSGSVGATGAGGQPGMASGAGTGSNWGNALLGAAGAVGSQYVGSTSSTESTLGGAAMGASYGAAFGPWGIVIGAVLGAIYGYFATADIPSINLIGEDLIGRAPYANLAPDARFRTDLGQFAFASIDEVSSEDRAALRDAVTDFDGAIADMLRGTSYLEQVRENLQSFNVNLQEGAITAENLLGARFDAILAAFNSDIVDFVNGAQTLEDRVQRLSDAVAVEQVFGDLDLGVAFGDFLQLLDTLALSGEDTQQTMQRVVGATRLLGDAMEVLGIDLGRTGEDFITFAADIAEAAGGLDRAQGLWARFYEEFFSDTERAQFVLERARLRAADEAEDIGLDPGIAMEEFRREFLARLPTLTPEEIADWLEFGEALADVNDAEQLLNDTTQNLGDSTEDLARRQRELADLLSDVRFDTLTAGMTDVEREMAEVNRDFDALRDRAIELGASQDELNEIESLRLIRLREITDATEDQVDMMDLLLERQYNHFEALQNQAQALYDATQGIRDFLDMQPFSATSSLNPLEQLQEAQLQFNELLALANAGDVDAMRSLAGAAQQLLGQAFSFFGPGEQFEAIEAALRASLQPFADMQDPGGELVDALGNLTEAINNALANGWTVVNGVLVWGGGTPPPPPPEPGDPGDVGSAWPGGEAMTSSTYASGDLRELNRGIHYLTQEMAGVKRAIEKNNARLTSDRVH